MQTGFWLTENYSSGDLICGGGTDRTRSHPRTGPGRASSEQSLQTTIEGVPHLLFYKRLNPGSAIRRHLKFAFIH